jgi:N-glycosylase/DNA lyase
LGAKTHILPGPHDLPERLKVSYRKRESIKRMAELIKRGFFEELLKKDYLQAFRELIQIKGIGGKVADCISLFCLNKEEAFPIDRWVLRALSKNYPWMVGEDESLTLKRYMAISTNARRYFGEYAGLAQQFLYMAMREGLLTS